LLSTAKIKQVFNKIIMAETWNRCLKNLGLKSSADKSMFLGGWMDVKVILRIADSNQNV
jgi:hypothetical protein